MMIKSLWGKTVCMFMVFVIAVCSISAVTEASTAYKCPKRVVPLQTQETILPLDKSYCISPCGLKQWLGQKAIRGVAIALRKGDSFVKNIANDLGGKEAKEFTKHINTIANVLDDLADRTDLVQSSVIDAILSALISTGVSSGVARTIANKFVFLVF